MWRRYLIGSRSLCIGSGWWFVLGYAVLVEGATPCVFVVAVCASRGFGQSVPVNRETPFVVGFMTLLLGTVVMIS